MTCAYASNQPLFMHNASASPSTDAHDVSSTPYVVPHAFCFLCPYMRCAHVTRLTCSTSANELVVLYLYWREGRQEGAGDV